MVRIWDKNMEDLAVEEICKKINIQANLIDLQSKNKKRINSALTTLPNGNRKILTTWTLIGKTCAL
jgi:hypothetical protein